MTTGAVPSDPCTRAVNNPVTMTMPPRAAVETSIVRRLVRARTCETSATLIGSELSAAGVT